MPECEYCGWDERIYQGCNAKIQVTNLPSFRFCTRKKGHEGNHVACDILECRTGEWTQDNKLIYFNNQDMFPKER